MFFFLCYSLFLFFPDFLKDFQGVSLTFKYYSRSSALIALALLLFGPVHRMTKEKKKNQEQTERLILGNNSLDKAKAISTKLLE